MIVNNIFYNEWEIFKKDFSKDIGLQKPQKFIFRGQHDAKYRLCASFDRMFPNLTGNERTNEAKKLLNYFISECEYYLPEVANMNEIEKLTYARQCGLPTRILDWTKSVYVAAFFAFSSVKTDDHNEYASIYALDISNNAIGSENGVSVISASSNLNYRQKYQQAIYTQLNTYNVSLEDYFEDYSKRIDKQDTMQDTILYKMNIPKSESNKVIKDLNFMNINYSVLFGDATGYANNALIRYITDKLYS